MLGKYFPVEDPRQHGGFCPNRANVGALLESQSFTGARGAGETDAFFNPHWCVHFVFGLHVEPLLPMVRATCD